MEDVSDHLSHHHPGVGSSGGVLLKRDRAMPNPANDGQCGIAEGEGSDGSVTARADGFEMHHRGAGNSHHHHHNNNDSCDGGGGGGCAAAHSHSQYYPHSLSPVSANPYHTVPSRRAFSLLELLGLFAVSFSYAFCFNTIQNIVIPKEVERLLPSRQSMWVGMIMGAGAVSQLATPIVGAWSDRAGSRTPFLVYGTFITILGIVLFLVVGALSDVAMLFLAHVVTTVGLSIQYSMVTALLNDYVTDEQQGRASGCMAILAILGSGAGYAMFATSMPLHYSFCSYILATVICLGVCVMFIPGGGDGASPAGASMNAQGASSLQAMGGAPGTSSGGAVGSGDGSVGGPGGGAALSISPAATGGATGHSGATPGRTASLRRSSGVWGCVDCLAHALSIPSPSRYPDFFYACLGRSLFNTGLAGQVYLVYYLRDVLAADNPVQITSMIAVMALLGGVVGALPSGIISDRIGKKPVIYGSVALCVLSVSLFMSVRGTVEIQLVGFVYGVGNVAYLSVDYALGVQSLPKKALTADKKEKRLVPIDAAKDLGVFAMSATAGQLFGQVLYGALLDQFGTITSTGTQYSTAGFVAVYSLAAFCFLCSGVSTAFVRGVR